MSFTKAKKIILVNLSLILCCYFPINSIGNPVTPPPVSITFFGPALEGAKVSLKCTVVIYGIDDANTVVIWLGERPNETVFFRDVSANFVRKDLKTPSGDIVSALEWTGYSDQHEITETAPAWLHEEKGFRMYVTAGIQKGNKLIAYTKETARFHPKALQAIIMAAKHNKSLKQNHLQ